MIIGLLSIICYNIQWLLQRIKKKTSKKKDFTLLQNIVKEKVIYMSFLNISFRNKNEAGAIGIIGGADGPTCIYTSKDIKNKKDEQEKFLSYAVEQIASCERTYEDYNLLTGNMIKVETDDQGNKETQKINRGKKPLLNLIDFISNSEEIKY